MHWDTLYESIIERIHLLFNRIWLTIAEAVSSKNSSRIPFHRGEIEWFLNSFRIYSRIIKDSDAICYFQQEYLLETNNVALYFFFFCRNLSEKQMLVKFFLNSYGICLQKQSASPYERKAYHLNLDCNKKLPNVTFNP